MGMEPAIQLKYLYLIAEQKMQAHILVWTELITIMMEILIAQTQIVMDEAVIGEEQFVVLDYVVNLEPHNLIK